MSDKIVTLNSCCSVELSLFSEVCLTPCIMQGDLRLLHLCLDVKCGRGIWLLTKGNPKAMMVGGESLRESVRIPWGDEKPWGCEAVCLKAAFFKNLSWAHCCSRSCKRERICTNQGSIQDFMDSVPPSGMEHSTCVTSPCWVSEQRVKVLAIALVNSVPAHRKAGSPQHSVTLFTEEAVLLILLTSLFFSEPNRVGATKCPAWIIWVDFKTGCSHAVPLLLD